MASKSEAGECPIVLHANVRPQRRFPFGGHIYFTLKYTLHLLQFALLGAL